MKSGLFPAGSAVSSNAAKSVGAGLYLENRGWLCVAQRLKNYLILQLQSLWL